MNSSTSDEDPHPELQSCFANEKYVERLVRELHTVRSKSQESPETSENLAEIEELLEQVFESEGSSDQQRKNLTGVRRG